MKRQRRREPCVNCSKVLTIQARGLCDSCYRKARDAERGQPERAALPPAPCVGGCGAMATSADRLCPHCTAHYRSAKTYEPRAVPVSDVLYGGDWVVVRGVRRWVPWEVA
ncbi:hypothetical protein [Nocardioides sp.]|uniref:hypothetical protein n=1 Tax=Nocardioides sp. TaxID=35761 RepID=UPI003516847D